MEKLFTFRMGQNDNKSSESNLDELSITEDKKAEGATTARDAPPDSIAPSEEENSKVGGSQEDGEASRPSNVAEG